MICNQEYEETKDVSLADNESPSGLCTLCSEKMNLSKKFTLADYLDTLPVPVFSINGEGTIDVANRSATQYFDKDVQHMQGARGGDVFECVYARLPGGCGKTVHCSACTVRRAVMYTYETGETIHRQPAYLKMVKKEGPQLINFFVTTIKYNQFVILRFEGLEG